MATKAQIAEQVSFERDAIKTGLARLHENTRKLEEREYASAAIYGVASIEQLMPPLIERIAKTAEYALHRGHSGRLFKELRTYLSMIEPEAAAAIACKVTFDKVFSAKESSNEVPSVTEGIGRAIENECQMRHYERECPGLLKKLKDNYWHRSIGTQQKVTVIQTLMNRYDIKPWKTWGRSERIKLGGWLLDCIIEVSGWFVRYVDRRGKKTYCVVLPSPEFMKIKDEVMANAELFSPLAWPMLIPPNDWSKDHPGGYLLNEVMRGHDMVRRGENGRLQGEKIYQFLNHIQKVAYKLNPFVVDVAETLQKQGICVGKFLPIVDHPLPPKPVDIAENKDSRKDYRRRAAEVMNLNAQQFRRSCRTRMTMEAVKRFKNRERFYLPWSLDYRGRAYPIPAFLTPQCTDFGKALLCFADESYVMPEAEEWLRFSVATSYGLDKAPIEERIQWTHDHESLIRAVALDPIGNLASWEGVDEPWQFLASCEELNACIIDCTRHYTRLPVAVDATNSGLQILAGLCRCKSTAEMVNVLPSDSPQDAYKVIAESAKPFIPERFRDSFDRKVTKRTVMTIPYNAKPYSNRSYIRSALKEKGLEPTNEELTEIVSQVRAAMYRIFKGPMQVMDWIESQVTQALEDGRDRLTWTTPSGFVVTQKLMKKECKTIKLQLMGRCEVNVAHDTAKVDLKHHRNATSPNLIHSLDSCLIQLSAIRFNAPIALIHDSVLCRATDMSILSTIVRETYMYLFAENDYLNDWAQQIGATEPPPIIGDLEPENVLNSPYFFC